tara:strand:+ start:384 stop:590 length:207 start_codon:yes stop_codon:yes gene_type:complete
MLTIDIDFIGSKEDAKEIGELWGIKITLVPNCDQAIAIVKGSKTKVRDFLIDHHYGDEQEVEEIYFSN